METDSRAAEIARMIGGNLCTLGDARTCEAGGYREACAGCGWRAEEVARRKRLPLTVNARGLWVKCVGLNQSK